MHQQSANSVQYLKKSTLWLVALCAGGCGSAAGQVQDDYPPPSPYAYYTGRQVPQGAAPAPSGGSVAPAAAAAEEEKVTEPSPPEENSSGPTGTQSGLDGQGGGGDDDDGD